MGDEMDVYLGRSLKNWAARHTPSLDTRRKLLHKALYSPSRVDRGGGIARLLSFFHHQTLAPLDEFTPFLEADSYKPGGLSLSMHWHISVTWRLERLAT